MDDAERRLQDERHAEHERRIGLLEDAVIGMRQIGTGLATLATKVDTCHDDTAYLRVKVDERDTQREVDRRADRRALWAVCGTIVAALLGAVVVLVIAFA